MANGKSGFLFLHFYFEFNIYKKKIIFAVFLYGQRDVLPIAKCHVPPFSSSSSANHCNTNPNACTTMEAMGAIISLESSTPVSASTSVVCVYGIDSGKCSSCGKSRGDLVTMAARVLPVAMVARVLPVATMASVLPVVMERISGESRKSFKLTSDLKGRETIKKYIFCSVSCVDWI